MLTCLAHFQSKFLKIKQISEVAATIKACYSFKASTSRRFDLGHCENHVIETFCVATYQLRSFRSLFIAAVTIFVPPFGNSFSCDSGNEWWFGCDLPIPTFVNYTQLFHHFCSRPRMFSVGRVSRVRRDNHLACYAGV
jgi:hypothetical protein